MKPRYSLSIPKPCHENWSEMTPNEKGRFCQSCSKTVVDFTSMDTSEVQEFMHRNKHQRICGHIKQSQLDTINLQIYDTVFEQRLNFHKVFLLALLLAMGTSIFSCSDEKGQTKKIESVEIIEKVMDSTKTEIVKVNDSSDQCKSKDKREVITKNEKPVKTPNNLVIDGLMITGEVIDLKPPIIHSDSIQEPEYPEIEGEMRIHDDVTFGLLNVQNPPEFKDMPEKLDIQEKKAFFQQKISNMVNDNFHINPLLCLDLSGRQKIYVQFTINRNGYTKEIKARGPNLLLEKEAVRVIKLLPQFKPARHNGEPVEMTYNLPIIFEVKDR